MQVVKQVGLERVKIWILYGKIKCSSAVGSVPIIQELFTLSPQSMLLCMWIKATCIYFQQVKKEINTLILYPKRQINWNTFLISFEEETVVN